MGTFTFFRPVLETDQFLLMQTNAYLLPALVDDEKELKQQRLGPRITAPPVKAVLYTGGRACHFSPVSGG
jgi:hypothetical protein